VSDVKKGKRISVVILVAAVAVIVGLTVWYFSPKTFLKGAESADVSSISVFDGNTGNSFVIDDESEIRYIVENIQSVSMTRGKVSVGYSGYSFRMEFYDNSGNVTDSFIMNSADTIRDDPFFYSCDGELCFGYIEGLESKYVK
jgi:hypothetical protein